VSDSLSPRERQVAALIARGLTNRQIANELVISERTADGHVAHILNKLALNTRAQVAVGWLSTTTRKQVPVLGLSTRAMLHRWLLA
jgi:DNA-binding NarL/FixJ family response regulator